MRYQDDPKIRAKYNCEKWKRIRKLKIQKANGLCESCLRHRIYREGKIVHHKIPITDENYETELMYSLDNLEFLCDECHKLAHKDDSDPYYFDEEGDLCGKESSYSSTTSRYKEIV